MFFTFYFILPQWLLFAMRPQQNVAEQLDDIALNQGYGYKYGNLILLKELLSKIEPKYGFQLKVPEFTGLSSPQIKLIFKKQGFDIDENWGKLIEENFKEVEQQEALHREKHFPEKFLQRCSEFQDEIIRHLDAAKSDVGFGGVREFIEMHSKEDGSLKLMVRSTGKEDSKELSNAGGNESVANVNANFDDVFVAIGSVIKSYFGQKSLLQRLRASDKSLFDRVQLTPVLIQVMAGAADRTKGTQCGVMFTEEPNMGAFTTGSTTTGITIIQSAFGHNESIVLGLIPFDTFYVDSDGNIFPIIRDKTDRMVPSEKSGELELVGNDRKIAVEPSLTEQEVRTLKLLSESLEEYYQGPMDVEFVTTAEPKEVLIVQARPIVKKLPSSSPSYFKEATLKSGQSVLEGQIILHGGSFVRQCTDESTITAKRITEAYKKWSTQSKVIQCIVLGDLAPETSHEATIFRSEGIAVIQTEEYNIVAEKLKVGKNFLLSTQQDCLLEIEPATIWDGWITLGWYSFPAPKAVSLIPWYCLPAQPRNRPEQQLNPTDMSVSQILYSLKNCRGTQEELEKNRILLSLKILEISNDYLKRVSDATEAGHSALRPVKQNISLLLRILWKYTELAVHDCHIQPKVPMPDTDEQQGLVSPFSANKLLHNHFINALINQAPTLNTFMSLSVHSIITRELIPIVATVSIYQQCRRSLLQSANYAYTENVHTNFANYVLKADEEMDEDCYRSFFEMVSTITKMEILPLWLQLTFQEQNPLRVIDDYKESEDFINRTLEIRRKVRSISPQSFNLKSFDKQFEVILQLVHDLTASSQNEAINTENHQAATLSFLDSLKSESTSKLAKIIAVKVMSELVELIDLSIKALKTSEDISPSNLVPLLEDEQDMVFSMFTLLEVWFSNLLVNPSPKEKLIKHETFKKIRAQTEKTSLSKEDFYFSPGFRVSSASLYSSSSSNRTSNVRTLEDAYSLTHQNLQYILGKLMVQYDACKIELPVYLSKIIKTFNFNSKSTHLFHRTNSHIIGIEMGYQEIIVISNEELANHGLLNNSERWLVFLRAYAAYRILGKFEIESIEYDAENGFGVEIIVNNDEQKLQEIAYLLAITSYVTESPSEAQRPVVNFSLIQKDLTPEQYAHTLKFIASKSGVITLEISGVNLDSEKCALAYEKEPSTMIEVAKILVKTGGCDRKAVRKQNEFIFRPMLIGKSALEMVDKLAKEGNCFLPFCFSAGQTAEFYSHVTEIFLRELSQVIYSPEAQLLEKFADYLLEFFSRADSDLSTSKVIETLSKINEDNRDLLLNFTFTRWRLLVLFQKNGIVKIDTKDQAAYVHKVLRRICDSRSKELLKFTSLPMMFQWEFYDGCATSLLQGIDRYLVISSKSGVKTSAMFSVEFFHQISNIKLNLSKIDNMIPDYVQPNRYKNRADHQKNTIDFGLILSFMASAVLMGTVTAIEEYIPYPNDLKPDNHGQFKDIASSILEYLKAKEDTIPNQTKSLYPKVVEYVEMYR